MIRTPGMVLLKGTGRPQLIFGGVQVKHGMLEHEVLITEVRLHFLKYRFQRSVPIGKTIADAMLDKEGTRFFIEVDMGGMDCKQMNAKWMRYGDLRKDFILVFCRTEGRLKRLKQGAHRVKDVALFSTFDRLKSGNHEPWEDCHGRATNL